MKEIKFSVLMSVYYRDKKEYLKEAIESIINQTLLPNELVIVEDGPLSSEMNTLLTKYTQKYKWIKLVKLAKNRGLGEALREGVKYCKYEYIARMDADDFSLPNRFEKQVDFLQRNPEIDLLGGYIFEYDEKLITPISIREVPLKEEQIKKFMKARNPFNHVSVIFKKSAVLLSGNYESMLYFEDYYLWCKMISNNCNVININEILVNVRAGKSFFKRRGGIDYAKAVIHFEKSIMKLGIIKRSECIKFIFIKLVIAISPAFLKKYVYMKKLRTTDNPYMKKSGR